jgi:hypothetical protein
MLGIDLLVYLAKRRDAKRVRGSARRWHARRRAGIAGTGEWDDKVSAVASARVLVQVPGDDPEIG